MTIQYLPSSIPTFKSLQSFNSLDQLNESIQIAFQNFKSILTKSSMRVLAHIAKYSVKYLGVSFLSKQSIADALDINIRTIRRAIRQLEELHLIKSYRLKRVNNDRRETSSAIVIQPLVSNVLPVCPTNKQSINSKDINNTVVTKEPAQKESDEQVIKDALLSKLPKSLRVLGYFFDADMLYKHVGTIYKAKKSYDLAIEDYEQEFELTIKQVIQSYKMGKVRNFAGVLFVAIQSLCKSIQLQSSLHQMFGT